MINQSFVKSGFDVEVLFGERYIKYLILNSIETGSLPLNMTFPVEDDDGEIFDMVINIYAPEDYERLYEPNPEAENPVASNDTSFDVFINTREDRQEDLLILVTANIKYGDRDITNQEIELYTTFALETETDDDGNQTNSKFRIELVDLGGLLIDLVLPLAGVTKEEALALMKPLFDRSIDIGLVGKDQNVQNVFMKKLPRDDSHPKAIGLYMNLKLKGGPEPDNFIGDRGDLDEAMNFLPENDDIAFGMPGSVYPLISKDAFERMAEETKEDSGIFIHPIHEDPSDKDSDIIGKIKNITITTQSGNLIIDVHGDYQIDVLPDPDFHLYITLKPSIVEGMIVWDMEYDVDLNPFLEIASLFLLTILSALFGPGGFIAGGIIAGIVFGTQELIVEPLLAGAVSEKGDSLVDASFFDAIPNRLTVERKRWDPFYLTRHQIVAKTDALQITPLGIGFSGKAVLDKEPEAISHVVIRDEERNDNGSISKLWYRVKDFDKSSNDFVSVFPGTDRREFEKVDDPKGEDDLFSISIPEAESRAGEFRLLGYILYVAKKVFIAHSQVDGILAISQKEINELESDLKKVFKNAEKEKLREEQGDDLREESLEELEEELDEDPTEEQIEERINEKLDKLVKEPLKEYTDGQLKDDLKQKIEETLRFDLPPEEMAGLQSRKIMYLSKFVIVRREGKPYYRDRKDSSTADNLMSLPGYKPERD